MIRPVKTSDIAEICDIYNHYVLTSTITFEETAVSVEDMSDRVADISAKYPWLVYEHEGKVAGYAYAGPWKSRCAYRHSVESTIYLRHDMLGQGMGFKLYGALIEELGKTDTHGVIGGVALPNEGSIALHKKLGFEQVAHFKEVGYKFDTWIDVTYWEMILT